MCSWTRSSAAAQGHGGGGRVQTTGRMCGPAFSGWHLPTQLNSQVKWACTETRLARGPLDHWWTLSWRWAQAGSPSCWWSGLGSDWTADHQTAALGRLGSVTPHYDLDLLQQLHRSGPSAGACKAEGDSASAYSSSHSPPCFPRP